MNAWCGAWLCAAWWFTAAAGDCDVTIDSHPHRREVLAANGEFTVGMAVDYRTGTLYFCYVNGSLHNVKVDLQSKALSAIEELSGLCQFSVDQMRGYVHAGCTTEHGTGAGLFQWDSHPARFVLEGEAGRNVRYVHYYNKTLFYSLVDDDIWRTFAKGHSAVVHTLPSRVYGLVVDAHGDLIFHNRSGLFRRRADGTGEMPYDRHWQVLALAVDRRGAAYVCDNYSPRSVWRLHDRSHGATRLLDIDCTSLTFDADDNMIVADDVRHKIIRLTKC